MKKKKMTTKKSSPKKQLSLDKVARNESIGITPLADRILIKELQGLDNKKTESGIYIPDSVKDDKGAKRGTVVAVGAGRYEDGKYIGSLVKAGDTILFSWGEHLTYEGEEYLLVREGEIMAIINT